MELKDKKPYYAVKDCGSISFSVKDVDTSKRTVAMVLNTYNYFDSTNDVLLSGCCSKSIQEHGPEAAAPDKIVHALFHDLTLLPGKMLILDEREIDGKSCLYAESKLADTTAGNDTLKNYLAGIYNQHSIGFIYKNASWIQRDNQHGNSKQWENMIKELINPEDAENAGYAYVVKEIQLFEGSTVALGANSQTPALGMKSANKDAVLFDYLAKIDLLKKTLRNGTQSDEQMKIFELQVLQLKQMMGDLFEQFTIKSTKEETKPADEKKDVPVELITDSLISKFSFK